MPAYDSNQNTQRAERRFFTESINAPLLTREHERELATRWRNEDDEAALHEIVFAYSRLVISTAMRFRNYGLLVADLVQEGSIGLLQAAARFEPERQVRFSTYASWWIRAAMQDFVLRNWSIVRTGTTAAQKSLFFNFRRLRAKIDRVDGPLRREGRERIASELKVKLKDVEMMESRLSASDQSLNAPVGENGEGKWQDFIADTRPLPEETVFEQVDSKSRSDWLYEALDSLSERERIIIGKRRLRDETVTLAELGRDLGISKERVRQIEHKALEKLRALLVCRVERPGDLIFGEISESLTDDLDSPAGWQRLAGTQAVEDTEALEREILDRHAAGKRFSRIPGVHLDHPQAKRLQGRRCRRAETAETECGAAIILV